MSFIDIVRRDPIIPFLTDGASERYNPLYVELVYGTGQFVAASGGGTVS